MNQLGDRNYSLISRGVSIEGTFNPALIFYAFEESLYVDESQEIWDFLEWVHKNNKSFGRYNYEQVFKEWKNTLRQTTA